MKITILAVGNLKERHWREAALEYVKRLAPYCRLEIIEVADEGFAAGMPAAEEEKIKRLEWNRAARRLREGTYLIALDARGEQVSSEELSAQIHRLGVTGRSHITFVIGGALGLPPEALERAHRRLSLSRLTFPHRLVRIILLEQLYRAYKIARGEPYHK
ncbi:MAG: 23S rRNA (pseudouridine(1915)-N(3))-methyltransferase RlmH [Firmicutes bacterium]|nr:23S rRNA (pseudouridine(1915)-N(3))-methyltransferase RlmH [Bacillota bacterium]